MIKTVIRPGNTALSTFLVMLLLFCISSCKNKKQIKAEQEIKRDPKEVAEDKNEKTFRTTADEKDAQFLVNATEDNLREVKMGQLAATRFRVHEVKDLANMLLTDHTKFLDELKNLALRKEIEIPNTLTAESEDAYKKLKEKEGANFDQEYCDMMIANHEAAIIKFEKASKECSDAEIKDWAANTLATLRDHLEFSKTCKKNLKKINKI